ncbi:PopZ family protein [Ensifer sp. BR816]|uniref:PopZ family protein n=1 Tax=Rhizobium sp. (strain BR816) TaxID=1057002 RepID=UPI000366200C|nr:PopZ family protein [Ensifer sp. BR816]
MAQLNVAREPSMDEILASIRKIIENNEPGLAGGAAAQTFEDGTDEIELTIDSEMGATAFDLSDHSASASPPSSSPEPTGADATASSSSPLSLADVAARVRAASERHASHYTPKEPASLDQAADPAQDSPMITSRMAAVSFPKATATVAGPAPDGPLSRSLDEEPAPAAPVYPAAPEAAGKVDTTGGAIVSSAVSRQVARAFDDLAHAVDHGPRRSFDEIAEAMLRPMLQEWLDDNLPTLVEKLVREEIERVARGPRR